MSALRDSSLRAIQECATKKDAQAVLNERYAVKSMLNKLGVLNSLLNKRLRQEENISNHIPMM